MLARRILRMIWIGTRMARLASTDVRVGPGAFLKDDLMLRHLQTIEGREPLELSGSELILLVLLPQRAARAEMRPKSPPLSIAPEGPV